MDNIQMLINKWKQGIAVYDDFTKMCEDFNWNATAQMAILAKQQLRDCITDAELLLNEQPEAITDDAHFANTHVSGSAASEKVSDVGNVIASSSETATVSGNEHTKEVCLWCGAEPIVKPWIKLCRSCFDKAR